MGCGSSQEQVVAVTITSKPEEWEAIRKRLAYSKSKYDTKRREELWDKIDKDRSGALTFVEVEKEAAKVLGLDKVMSPDQLRPVLIRAFNAAKKFRVHAHKQASVQEQHHIGVAGLSEETANTNKNVDPLLAESIRLGISLGSTGGFAGSLPSPISAPSPTKRAMTPQTGSSARGRQSSSTGIPSNHRFSVLEGSLRRDNNANNVSLSVASGGGVKATNPLNGPPGKSLAVERQEMASHSSRPPLSSVSSPIYANVNNKKLMSPLSPDAIVSADVFGEDLEAPAEQEDSQQAQPFKNFGSTPSAGITPFPPVESGGSGTNDMFLGSSSTAVTPPIGALPSALRRPSGDASNPSSINGGAVSSKKRVSIVLMNTDGAKDGEAFLSSGSNVNHLTSVTSSGGGVRVEPTTTTINTNAPQRPLLAASPPQALVALTAIRPSTGAGAGGTGERVGTAVPPMSAAQKEKFHQLQRDEFRIFLMYIAEYMELYVIFRDIATNNSSASGGSITITDEQKAQAAALDANVREANPKLKLKPVKKGFFSSSSSSSSFSSSAKGGSVKFVTAMDFMEAIPRLIQWGIQVDKEDPMSTFYLIDTSRSGTISFKEFSDWVIIQHMETTTM